MSISFESVALVLPEIWYEITFHIANLDFSCPISFKRCCRAARKGVAMFLARTRKILDKDTTYTVLPNGIKHGQAKTIVDIDRGFGTTRVITYFWGIEHGMCTEEVKIFEIDGILATTHMYQSYMYMGIKRGENIRNYMKSENMHCIEYFANAFDSDHYVHNSSSYEYRKGNRFAISDPYVRCGTNEYVNILSTKLDKYTDIVYWIIPAPLSFTCETGFVFFCFIKIDCFY